jgi:hypothetical protein
LSNRTAPGTIVSIVYLQSNGANSVKPPTESSGRGCHL